MKRLIPIAAVSLLLAGCASTAPAATSTPEPATTVSPNAIACKKFEGHTTRIADLVVKLWTAEDEWTDGDEIVLDDAPAELDRLSLASDGEVSERLATISEYLTDTALVIVSTDPDEYFDMLKAVQRACAADGVDIGVSTWS